MQTFVEYQDATPLLGDAEALGRQMESDGFLFFRGLIPQDALMDLRRQILLICEKYGWIRGGAELMNGIVEPAAHEMEVFCGVGVTQAAYADVYRLEAFHRLAHHPAILDALHDLIGETVLAHPRHIARMMFPTAANAPTPPHQDHIFIQGSKTVYTCWFPAGDCPMALGGLSVLRGSHVHGIYPVRAASGAGGRAVILGDEDQVWYQGDFAAGDALLFHSLVVHKSSPNQMPDRLRLSIDYRYQPVSAPVEEKSLRPHCEVLAWDEAYAGWASADLKYYWRQYNLQPAEWDTALLDIQPG